VAQSCAPLHEVCKLHVAQPPPQSTTSSLPFLVPSTQLGAEQRSFLHTPLAQSVFDQQVRSVPQGAQAPPQSMLDSRSLRTPSLQLGATQRRSTQRRLLHSASSKQESLPQRAQPPPQSTPVSDPLRTPSPQLAAAHCPRLQIPLAH